MSAEQPKPRFEPPPWEQEAFERFRKEQEELRAKQELNAVLHAALGQAEPASVSPSAAPESTPPAPPKDVAPAQSIPAPEAPVVPEAEVAAMLIELRQEEVPVKRVNAVVVNAVMGFMAAMGLYIIIRAMLLAGDIQSGAGANTLLASTVSIVVFVTGCGFLGGAYFLFRKYYR